MTARRRAARALTGGAIILLLAGCTVGPDYAPPAPPPAVERAERFTYAVDPTRFAHAAAPEADWWRQLDDPLLDRLIAATLEANHDLRIAEANLRAARALLGFERLRLLPTDSVDASVTRTRNSEAVLPPPPGPGAGPGNGGPGNGGPGNPPPGGGPDGDRTNTFYSAALDARWQLDLFGGIRRAIQAQRASVESQDAAYRALAVTLSAEVARTYAALRRDQLRRAIAARSVRNQEKTRDLVALLFDTGSATDFDRARADALLADTRAALPALDADIARAIHRLGLLGGRAPDAFRAALEPPGALPTPPEPLAIAEPAALLRRRPDVEAAERDLAAATARIGVATADLFPQIGLVGRVGVLALEADELGDDDSQTLSFGPFLRWSILDLARVRRQIEAREAEADAALARFEQTVLATLEETETALARYAYARVREQHLESAARASEHAVETARLRYRHGVASFLELLEAEQTVFAAQDREASAQADSVDALIDIYQALAGAWQPADDAGATGNGDDAKASKKTIDIEPAFADESSTDDPPLPDVRSP
ncbi:MAG: efflux transporter outer membrane subunit [Acidobacteriota bacterium]